MEELIFGFGNGHWRGMSWTIILREIGESGVYSNFIVTRWYAIAGTWVCVAFLIKKKFIQNKTHLISYPHLIRAQLYLLHNTEIVKKKKKTKIIKTEKK